MFLLRAEEWQMSFFLRPLLKSPREREVFLSTSYFIFYEVLLFPSKTFSPLLSPFSFFRTFFVCSSPHHPGKKEQAEKEQKEHIHFRSKKE